MPSFDVVSEFDMHELSNAVDQANREIMSRFDLKSTGAKLEQKEAEVVITAPEEFQISQLIDILEAKAIKRGIDVRCIDAGNIEKAVHQARQIVTFRQGLDKELAKKVTKAVKESKMKVQAAIQGDKVRITGKKRDDLQQAISMLKETDLDLPLQFNNFRD